MKKCFYILIALLLCACEPADIPYGYSDNTKSDYSVIYYEIYKGYTFNLLYVVKDNVIYEGYSYKRLYTIRDDGVFEGYSYNRLYTIRDDGVYEGYSYNRLYTIKTVRQ